MNDRSTPNSKIGDQKSRKKDAAENPGAAISGWMQDGFHNFFLPRYLRKHFHSVAIDLSAFDPQRDLPDDSPVLIYGNHPSWWDPLIAMFLNRQLFAPRQFFAPIDADMLQQYAVFKRLGFYGVRMNRHADVATFLKTSMAVLHSPDTALWITPEGRFCDVRDYSQSLRPGLAHLVHRVLRQRGQQRTRTAQTTGDENSGAITGPAYVLPLAIEYPFWDERLPLMLAKTGSPLRLDSVGRESGVTSGENADEPRETNSDNHSIHSKVAIGECLQQRLRQTQEELAQLVVQRCDAPFTNLLSGKKGAGGTYGFLRRVRSWFGKSNSDEQHGEQFS
ncbi:MAG: lysophospholipid acyltransferase family protein [Planctomycetota bacterium]